MGWRAITPEEDAMPFEAFIEHMAASPCGACGSPVLDLRTSEAGGDEYRGTCRMSALGDGSFVITCGQPEKPTSPGPT